MVDLTNGEMKNTDQIDALVAKSISGNASEEERLQLADWLAQSADHQKIYDNSLYTWNAAETWLEPENIRKDKLTILAEVNRNLVVQSHRIKRRSIVYLVAAILAFPIAIAVSLLFFGEPTIGQLNQTIAEVSAPAGHISKCKLPDGTEVWINSGSKITYDPLAFNAETREVYLDGEAYFDVVQNKRKAFYVRSAMADVKVTGTSFNVKAHSDSQIFETVLTEGSILLDLKREGTSQQIEVKPGERVIYETGQEKFLVQDVDTRIYSAWRDGQIIFQDATLNDLIAELERIYDVKFKLSDPGLGNYRFRGAFSYDANLIDALEKFKVTARIGYRIENKEVWLKKQ
ncbi:MAG: DUF4974 domain-containing protein [Prolixibacteraceae bacterium]|nr:DUF4974 domain-containing protein [Prolixibacteraceae bacterium]